MSLAKKAISGTIWMSGISYVGFAINFGVQLVLVRLLVPEDFGIFTLGLSIAEILFIFFSFSFSMAVIQIREAADLFDTAFYLSLITGLVILLIGGIISMFLLPYYPFPSVLAFFILCALRPVQSCSSIYSASMEKELQFKKNAIVRGLASNSSGFIAVFLAYMGIGVWSLVGREIITVVLTLLGMRYFANYRFNRKFNKETAKKLFQFGYKMLFSRGLEIIYHRVPNFFIGTFAGTKALGLFSQTYYLANLPNAMLAPATMYVAYPSYSRMQHDREKGSKALYITNFFLVRLMIPIMVVFFLYPTEILQILYGEKWIGASSILQYFAIYAVILPLFSNVKTFLYSLGKLSEVSRVYLTEILILSFGIFAALYTGRIELSGLAYSLSLLLGLFAALFFARKGGIEIYTNKIFLIPAIFTIVFVLLWPFIIDINITTNRMINLINLIIIFIVSWIIILLLESRQSLENYQYVRCKMK